MFNCIIIIIKKKKNLSNPWIQLDSCELSWVGCQLFPFSFLFLIFFFSFLSLSFFLLFIISEIC